VQFTIYPFGCWANNRNTDSNLWSAISVQLIITDN